MGTKPLADQHLAQLAAQPRREPVGGDVQLAALCHAVLYLHVQLGGDIQFIVPKVQSGLDAEFGRPAERPLPAAQLCRRLAESRKH